MKKLSVLFIILIIIVAAAFFGYMSYQKGQLHEILGRGAGSTQPGNKEGKIPQSGDLCGGTGGIGEIISIGNNTITLKQKTGKNLITHLTSQTIIKTPAGSAAISDLKIGDRVTLVGGSNPDSSFSADAVLVCSGTGQETQSGQK